MLEVPLAVQKAKDNVFILMLLFLQAPRPIFAIAAEGK